MSVATQIGAAVVAEMNAHEFAQEFTAEFKYLPLVKLTELSSLTVTVVPGDIERRSASRGSTRQEVKVEIGVQQKVADEEPATIDPMMTLVEEIAAFFDRRRLTEYSKAGWIRTEYPASYLREHIEEYGVFTCVITVTFWVVT